MTQIFQRSKIPALKQAIEANSHAESLRKRLPPASRRGDYYKTLNALQRAVNAALAAERALKRAGHV